MTLFEGGITINVFNISKLNSESGRMRRLQEEEHERLLNS